MLFAPVILSLRYPESQKPGLRDIIWYLRLTAFFFSCFSGNFYPIVHGSHPTAVRLVMNIFKSFTFLTFGNSIWMIQCVSYSAGIVRFCSCLPEPLSASFDIISILCSGSLLRHHTHQYAHRPLDAHYFWFLQVSLRIFHSPTHLFRVLSCTNLTFLLPRSTCIVSMFHGWISRG